MERPTNFNCVSSDLFELKNLSKLYNGKLNTSQNIIYYNLYDVLRSNSELKHFPIPRKSTKTRKFISL